MVAVPRSQSFSRCCSCMKNGQCVRCACVKRGQLCVDCWLSKIKPKQCMNSIHTAQGSTVNSTPIHPPAAVPEPDMDHQSTNECTYESPIESTQQLASEFHQSSTESIQLQPDASTCEIESLISLVNTYIKVVKRVPRLSRVTVARKLANAVEQVVS